MDDITLDKLNSDWVVKKFAELDEYTVHVTQVIDMCQKELVLSNVEHILHLPTTPHIYSLVGTAVHKFIRDYVNGEASMNNIEKYTNMIKYDTGKFKHCVRNFAEWYEKNESNFGRVYTELTNAKIVYDKGFKVTLTGTADFIYEDDTGSYSIVDFKTSKTTNRINIYEEQVGGYKYIFTDRFSIIHGAILILGSHNYRYVDININRGEERFVNDLLHVIQTISEIRETKHVYSTLGFRCAMCRFRGICLGNDITEVM
ncbi:MAG: hypothetical protein DRN17_03430 [Thermoplasmata archaeon]|nr:MAG: hypothetical protein DRN17_03430 [Thermoplasmata archaeon]